MKHRWLAFTLCAGLLTLICGILSLAVPQQPYNKIVVTLKMTDDTTPLIKALESLEKKPEQIKIDRSKNVPLWRTYLFGFFGFIFFVAVIVSIYEFSYDVVGKYLSKRA